MIKKQNSSFRGDVLRLLSGTSLAQIISLAAAPILARLYGVEAFGVLAIFAAITGIIIPIANLRYELSIVLPENDAEASNLLAVSLAITILITVIIVLIIGFAGKSILTLIKATELLYYIWLIPVAIFIGGVNTVLNYWNTRTKHFTQLSISRIINQFTGTVSSLGFGLNGYSTSISLIISSIAGQLLATTILATHIILINGKFLISYVNLKSMWAGLRRYKKFPILNSWGALINAASWQLPILMLSGFFSPTVVGFYSLGFRLIQIPMSLIGASISQVFLQRGATVSSDKELALLVDKTFNKLLQLGLLPSAIILTIGADLFSYIFGDNWREAGIYVQILLPWALVWFISSPLSNIYIIREDQKGELMIHSLVFLVRFLAILIGGYYESPRLAISLFSIGGLMAYGYMLINIFNRVGLRIISQLIKITREVLLTCLYVILLIALYYAFGINFIILIIIAITASMFILWRLHSNL